MEHTASDTCCFTGYRPDKLPWGYNEKDVRCDVLKKKIYDAALTAYECGIRRFICGMALGSDTYFCEAVLRLRSEYPDICLEAAIPYPGQSDSWTFSDRIRYSELISRCDMQTVACEEYTRYCMMSRNRYMVDESSLIICVFDGHKGGTRNTVDYARKRGLSLVIIAP